MDIEITAIDIINGERVLHELKETKIVHSPEEINEFQEEVRQQYMVQHPDCIALATYRANELTSRLIKKYFHDKERAFA